MIYSSIACVCFVQSFSVNVSFVTFNVMS